MWLGPNFLDRAYVRRGSVLYVTDLVPGTTYTLRARVGGVAVSEPLVAPAARTTTGEDGASAYEVWLAAGNSGTVGDFLASLKGDQGEQGLPGEGTPAIAVGPDAPAFPAGFAFLWVQTELGPTGEDATMWIEDGA